MSEVNSKLDLQFDIVVCVGPNDNEIVEQVLPYTKKNIIGYRNIYLVCANPDINVEKVIIIDEKIFPFSKNNLVEMFGDNSRNGWYLQQLLKFYSGKVIPDILKRYLIIDCDTHFLRPTKFITDDGKHILTTGTEYHVPYFLHMNKLDSSLGKHHPLSGISHHTFFHTDRVNNLMKLVEDNYLNEKPFWKIYLDLVDRNEFMGSGAAENETYFTYMYIHHPDEIVIRQLNWENVSKLEPEHVNNYDFVSVHWYLRK